MLDIRTPLSKLTRVSRKIAPATFIAVPGVWAELVDDGSIVNADSGSHLMICKLVIGSNSANVYESHDVEVGRITTLESVGVRCAVDSDGFAGTPAIGTTLMVNATGKLAAASALDMIVAISQGYDSATGLLTFETVSPYIL